MNQQVERGKKWLETLVRLMGLATDVKTDETLGVQEEANACWLMIDEARLTNEQIDLLIGNRGEGIDAIQYLANTLVNLGIELEEQRAFTVELAGYRQKRQEELKVWAQQVADRVRQTGQEVEMRSLSSAERRQIHTFLQDVEDLATESRGQEPDRRLVVRLREIAF